MSNSVIDLLSVLLAHRHERDYLSWYLNHSRRLLKFKNIHKGQDCFIIGNGPSLNKMDLSLLNDFHTFGLNKIYLLFDKVKLDLSYHVAVNPLVIEQIVDDIDMLQCQSFLAYGPSHALFHNPDKFFFLATDAVSSVPQAFYEDLRGPISEGYTVTFVALQIAFYMGFENVFLVGVDHSFQAVGQPNEQQLLAGDDPNHFDPRYFSNKQWHLPDLEGSELSYRLADFAYNRSGRSIYDATVGGKLQVFAKMPYETALEKCRKRQPAGFTAAGKR